MDPPGPPGLPQLGKWPRYRRALGAGRSCRHERLLRPEAPSRQNINAMALTHPATVSPLHPANSAPGALAASAAIICLDEAACIGKCLESLGDFAEIVVVDSGSTDGTLALVDDYGRRGFPIRLINQPWLGYARQKQFALDQATQPWVFSIDADEWLDDELRDSLPRLMAADNAVSGWKVRRSLTLYGRSEPVSRWTRPEHILRLVRRGRARFDPALIVHEGLVADEGETPIARQGLLRHERSLPLNEQMKKEIVYARLKAEQRLKLGRKPSRLKLLFNPPIYFLRIFFWNRFFLCGWAGFIHAATGAMYSLMTEAIHRQLYYARTER
jgi:glycosyltransferase involved in cell wall biosynthesis